MKVREQELRLLRRENGVWALSMFCMVLSPVFAYAATFAVFVLISDDNILTASLSFSVLLLFAVRLDLEDALQWGCRRI